MDKTFLIFQLNKSEHFEFKDALASQETNLKYLVWFHLTNVKQSLNPNELKETISYSNLWIKINQTLKLILYRVKLFLSKLLPFGKSFEKRCTVRRGQLEHVQLGLAFSA